MHGATTLCTGFGGEPGDRNLVCLAFRRRMNKERPFARRSSVFGSFALGDRLQLAATVPSRGLFGLLLIWKIWKILSAGKQNVETLFWFVLVSNSPVSLFEVCSCYTYQATKVVSIGESSHRSRASAFGGYCDAWTRK